MQYVRIVGQTNDGNLGAVQQSVVTELEEPVYHWSFSTLWRMEGKHVYVDEFKCPECASLMFPELYFRAQREFVYRRLHLYSLNCQLKKCNLSRKYLFVNVLWLADLWNLSRYLRSRQSCSVTLMTRKSPTMHKRTSLSKNSVESDVWKESAAALQLEHGVQYPDFYIEAPFTSFFQGGSADYSGTVLQTDWSVGSVSGRTGNKILLSICWWIVSDRCIRLCERRPSYRNGGRIVLLQSGGAYVTSHSRRISIYGGYALLHKQIHLCFLGIYCIFIYNAEATMPKYGAQGYLYSLLDTGIMVSTLNSVGEMLGIGMCSIGDMLFDKVKPLFGLNENQVWLHTVEGVKTGFFTRFN